VDGISIEPGYLIQYRGPQRHTRLRLVVEGTLDFLYLVSRSKKLLDVQVCSLRKSFTDVAYISLAYSLAMCEA